MVKVNGHREYDQPFGSTTLRDPLDLQVRRDHPAQQDQLDRLKPMDEEEAPKLFEWNFVGKVKCELCKTLVAGNLEVCTQCGFMFTKTLEELKEPKEPKTKELKSFEEPKEPKEPTKIENSVNVECFICFEKNVVDQNQIFGRFCEHCGFALCGMCPHCGISVTGSGSESCQHCFGSFWNY